MNIDKVPIPGFDNNEIKYEHEEYPTPPKKSGLPLPFYSCLAIGATGTGKTVAVVRLLKYNEKAKYFNKDGEVVPQRIFIFSPTIEANEIYYTLKNLDKDNDIITNYTDAALQKVLDEIAELNDETKAYNEVNKVWKKFQKIKSERSLSNEELIILENLNWEAPPKPRYPNGVVNQIILDDLVAQPGAFRPNGNSAISNLVVKNRHLSCNVFILAQSTNQIPKICRAQARLLLLYRFNSKKMTDDLYDVVSSLLTPEEFQKIYDDTTQEKYNFLCVDNTSSNLILKQNYNFLIKLKRKKKGTKLELKEYLKEPENLDVA